MTPTDWHDQDSDDAKFAFDVCGLLSDYIAAIVPRGAVERPDAGVDVEFIIALVGCERDPSDANTLRLHTAFLDVMDAWWEVAWGHAFRPLGA